jgi:dTMP kinase
VLAAGITVLCNQYVCVLGHSHSQPLKRLLLTGCHAPDVCLSAPDLTVFLNLVPEVAASRGGYGEERYKEEALQACVRMLFQTLLAETHGWIMIDVQQDMGCHIDILKCTEPLV